MDQYAIMGYKTKVVWLWYLKIGVFQPPAKMAILFQGCFGEPWWCHQLQGQSQPATVCYRKPWLFHGCVICIHFSCFFSCFILCLKLVRHLAPLPHCPTIKDNDRGAAATEFEEKFRELLKPDDEAAPHCCCRKNSVRSLRNWMDIW